MDLKRNIIDNVLECEAKIGHESLPVTFYYPIEELTDLLGCDVENLDIAIEKFKEEATSELGDISIVTQENGNRYAVTIPSEGVDWISSNYQVSDFIRRFIVEIRMPLNTLEDMVAFFESFDSDVIVEKESEDEWAIFFDNEDVDPYVYYIEKNVFGLEYHRFTYSAYQRLKKS